MSAWRRKALEDLPEFRSLIEEAKGPMALWVELGDHFDKAVQAKDDGLVKRILRFAAWCGSERSGQSSNDTSTAVHCAFYEHLPTRKAYWPLMNKWFGPHEFTALLPIFAYHVSKKELAELKNAYRKAAA